MGESTTLRAGDYRTILRLVGDCRDLGADPVAWRLHLLTSLCKELGARVGAGGEATGMSRGQFIPLSTVDVGWENNGQRLAMFEWIERQIQSGEPAGLLPMEASNNDELLMSRREAYTDREWYNSVQFADYLRRSELDDLVISFQRISGSPDHFCGLTMMRSLGEKQFTQRDKLFLATIHREIVPLVGRQLALANEPSALELSPRRREVLNCLLEGDSEQQVADRLGLTRQTVNQYVKSIYRHFRVNSRAELMARWIRFGTHDQALSSRK